MSSGGSNRPQTITNVTTPPPYLNEWMNSVQSYFPQVGTGSLTPRIPDNIPLQAPIHPLINAGNYMQLSNIMDPSQQRFANAAQGGIMSLLNGQNNTMSQLGNNLAPTLQNTIMNMMNGGQNPALNHMGAGYGGYTSAVALPTFDSGGGKPAEYRENPYVQQMIDANADDLARAFQRNDLRDIRNAAVAAGQLGSTRQGVSEGIATDSLQRAMLREAATIRGGAYENAMGRDSAERIALMQSSSGPASAAISANASLRNAEMANRSNMMMNGAQLAQGLLSGGQNYGLNALQLGLSAGPGAFNYMGQLGQQMTGIGGQYQQYNQNSLDELLRRYQINNSTTASDLQLLGSLVNGSNPGAFNSNTQTQNLVRANPWMAATGGAMSGASTGYQMGGTWGAIIGGLLGAYSGYSG